MLRPIPIRILTSTARLDVPTKTDRNGKATYVPYYLNYTHLQPCNSTKRTKDNTEVTLRSLLFVDRVNSRPQCLNYNDFKSQADELGTAVKVTVGTETYTLVTVEPIPDDQGKIHHWELGIV